MVKVGFAVMICLLGCPSIISVSSTLIAASVSRVYNKPGVFSSPNRACEASLKISEMGGFLNLFICRQSGKCVDPDVAKDVTGIAWLNGNNLVYTVSPIYGKPGIFLLTCASGKTKRIIGPKTINKAYPDGADYFELQGASSSDSKIYFYYAPDIDLVDFNKFRSREFLYEVRLDGAGFGKARIKGSR